MHNSSQIPECIISWSCNSIQPYLNLKEIHFWKLLHVSVNVVSGEIMHVGCAMRQILPMSLLKGVHYRGMAAAIENFVNMNEQVIIALVLRWNI